MAVMIHFCSEDGEELEEQWPSPDAFYSWAITEQIRGTYTAYEEDEDGDWVRILSQRIDGG
ncbi:MAG: hypothetical protein HRU15_00785 [Planctomycetes bacterium]|nr:hypothetical protein [Planctomycetota bacterium]